VLPLLLLSLKSFILLISYTPVKIEPDLLNETIVHEFPGGNKLDINLSLSLIQEIPFDDPDRGIQVMNSVARQVKNSELSLKTDELIPIGNIQSANVAFTFLSLQAMRLLGFERIGRNMFNLKAHVQIRGHPELFYLHGMQTSILQHHMGTHLVIDLATRLLHTRTYEPLFQQGWIGFTDNFFQFTAFCVL
jgi:hypothetical protein